MNQRILGGISVIALMSGSSAAWALTGQEAWEHWKTQAESFGMTLQAGGESSDGGALTLQDVSYAFAWEDVVEITYALGSMVLTEAGDAVEVTHADASTLAVKITPPDDLTLEASIEFTHPGAKTTVTQDGDAIVEHSIMPEMAMTLGPVTFDGAVDESFSIAAEYRIEGLDYTRSSTKGGAPVFTTQSTISLVEGGYEFSVPEEGMSMKSSSSARDMTSDGEVNLGSLLTELQGDLTEIDEMAALALAKRVLDSGFAIQGSTSYAESTSKDEGVNEAGNTMSDVTLRDSHAEFGLNADGLRYVASSGAFDVKATVPDIPIPEIHVTGAGGDSSMEVPFKSGSAPSPVSLRVALRELNVGEPIWSMLDPAAVMPREPLTLVVDLAGTVRWLSDMLSPETFAAPVPPIEPYSLDLKELQLKAVGAELTGTGSFTFDNTDLETFPGAPRPEGSASFKLVGGNGLLDNLTKLGVVPEDQVMMVRMFSGMFAKPGDGDEMTTEVAISPDGQILINGAPLPF